MLNFTDLINKSSLKLKKMYKSSNKDVIIEVYKDFFNICKLNLISSSSSIKIVPLMFKLKLKYHFNFYILVKALQVVNWYNLEQ